MSHKENPARFARQKHRELGYSAPSEFDPEASKNGQEDSSDGASSTEEDELRQHYSNLGPSTFRNRQSLDLGPEYLGCRVRRRRSSDISQEDLSEFSVPKDEADQKRPVGYHSSSGEENATSSSHTTADVSDIEDYTTDSEVSSNGQRSRAPTSHKNLSEQIDVNQEIRQIMASDRQAISSTMTAAAISDIEKGRALKKQRNCFDSLLNVRIKLQKTLTATNSLSKARAEDRSLLNLDLPQDAFDRFNVVANELWLRLDNIRASLDPEQSSNSFDSNLQQPVHLSSRMQMHEKRAIPRRRQILEKWAQRVDTSSRAMRHSSHQRPRHSFINVLDQQLSSANAQRLLTRGQTLDPIRQQQRQSRDEQDESSNKISPHLLPLDDTHNDPQGIYNDADFYTNMLRQLVSSRLQSNTLSNGSDVLLSSLPSRRELRTRKVVDSRASKGRKMRYTTHDKLVNFIPAEDLGTWEPRQRHELFSSLFGKPVDLDENLANDGNELAPLQLFKSK